MSEINVGDVGEEVRLLQKALNEKLSLTLTTDGQYGKITQSAVKLYQLRNELKQTAIYDKQTKDSLAEYINHRFLKISDIVVAANSIGVYASMLLAFREIEGKNEGFLPDGRPVILFERHKFYSNYKKSNGVDAATTFFRMRPDICNPDPGGYLGGALEYTKLNLAAAKDKTAAQLSASWGLFQIMGFNHEVCGYPTVDSFVSATNESEKNHLACVVKFITKTPGLLQALKQRDYTRVAQIYNGPSQRGYDNRLRIADIKYKGLGY